MQHDASPTRKSHSTNAALLLAAASIAFTAILLLRTATPAPLGDFAEWTYHGVLLRDVLQGHPNLAYTLKNYPVPNSLTTIGLGLLMLFLPWQLAAKLWLLLGAALGLTCAIRLQRAAGNLHTWTILILPATILFGSAFWFGFTNFLFATYLAMLFAALLLRRVETRWLYAALLVLTFFTHMIPFAFALLLLTLYALQNHRYRILWQSAPSLALCLWYFLGRALHANADAKAGMIASVPYLTPLFLAFKANTYLKCWGFINPAFGDHDSLLLTLLGSKLFLLLFLLNLLLALTLLTLLARTAFQAIATHLPTRFFWIAATIFFFAALFLPGAAAGISDPGGRMMQVALWSAMCLIPTQKRPTALLLTLCAATFFATDCYLLTALIPKTPQSGSIAGPLPTRLREFGHVYYADRLAYYDSIDHPPMNLPIYPTAMFLKNLPPK